MVEKERERKKETKREEEREREREREREEVIAEATRSTGKIVIFFCGKCI